MKASHIRLTLVLLTALISSCAYQNREVKLVAEIFKTIEDNYFYEWGKKQRTEFVNCMLQRALTEHSYHREIPEKTPEGEPVTTITLTIQQCIKEDPHVRYIGPDQNQNDSEESESNTFIEASWIKPDVVGYLYIAVFGGFTKLEIESELSKFYKREPAILIFDMRRNRGGLNKIAQHVLNFFAPREGLTTLELRDRNGNVIDTGDDFITPRRGELADWKLVVLVDEECASACEWVAEDLRQWGMATLIGTTTHGKGTVQGQKRLGNGAILLLTTAQYFLPNGETPDGKGITPDIFVEDTGGEEDLVLARALEYLRKQ